jgi:hypothetical protein
MRHVAERTAGEEADVPCRCVNLTRQSHWGIVFVHGGRSFLASFKHRGGSEWRGDRRLAGRGTRPAIYQGDADEARLDPKSSTTRSPHAHGSLVDGGLSAHMHMARVVCGFDSGWIHRSRLRNMLVLEAGGG